MSAHSVSRILTILKKKYIHGKGEDGGTRKGFVEYLDDYFVNNEEECVLYARQSWLEAGKKKWQDRPRNNGPDLFAINSLTIPEFLTRPKSYDIEMGNLENEDDGFEKVDQEFATLSDLAEDTNNKLRKTAQSSAAAEKQAQAYDEARKRARGNMAARLLDLKDE